MKTYAIIGGVILAGALGVLAFADLPATAPQVEPVPVPPPVNDPVWDGWEKDFDAMLDTDEEYMAAKEAAETYAGDDPDEYSRLESIREARYRELTRIVYERHFGKWTGDDAAFDELIAAVGNSLRACGRAAVYVCGEGKVCWVSYRSGGNCAIACQAGGGPCPAMPPNRTGSR
jgi:hypothetical protein